MPDKDVPFTYTRNVYFPKHLAATKGHTHRIPIADAQRLADQGYGKIVTASTAATPVTEETHDNTRPKAK